MPIRLRDQSVYLGRAAASLDNFAPNFDGSFVGVGTFTGTLARQLQPFTGAMVGQYQSVSLKTGTIGVTLQNASAAIVGATADTVAPPAPSAPTIDAFTSTSITIRFPTSAAPDHASWNVWRSPEGNFWTQIATGITAATYTNSGLTASTAYYYALVDVDTSSNASALGTSSSQTTAASDTLYWEADFEEGDMSEFPGSGSGGITVEGDGEAYEGTYYASRVLANGSDNDYGDYTDYGTPGSLGTQIRNYYAQVRSSFDTFTGSWPSSSQKIFIFQFYDSTAAGAGDNFSNGKRKYQMILTVAGQGAGAREGEYVVELLEWNNESGGTLNNATFIYQNSTAYGPADSFGSWDTLRMRVDLDTNGSGNLGHNGNGVLQVWLNNELIINYSDINFVDGNTDVGMGRMLLSSKATATWVGSSTEQFWDEIQVGNAASVLSAMPSASVSRTGDDNPDSYAAATTTYWSKDYETENAAVDMWINGGGGVTDHEYLATGGYGGSGAWKVTPTPVSGANEDNAGWSGGSGSSPSPDDTDIITFSYLFYMTQELADAISAGTSGFWSHGNKAIDVFMYTSDGSHGLDTTRQVQKFRNNSGAVQFSMLKGGAGAEFYDDGVNTNPDWTTIADQWVWCMHVFDATNHLTTFYYKLEGDAGVTRAIQRGDGDGADGDFVYGTRGWSLLQPSGGPAKSVWGYWDDISNISPDAAMFVKLDRLRIANGWVDPPF